MNSYYNKKAKYYLENLDFKNYSSHEIRDAIKYIYDVDFDNVENID